MSKNRTMVRLMRFFLTLLGAGVGVGAAALLLPVCRRFWPDVFGGMAAMVALYAALGLVCAFVLFLLSGWFIRRTMHMLSSIERVTEKMSTGQMVFLGAGLVFGLVVAFFITQLILSAGSGLVTISASALTYLVLGYLGMRLGQRRYRSGKGFSLPRLRRGGDKQTEDFADEEEAEQAIAPVLSRKFLDTSAIIDGRILDIVKTGFLEGELVAPQFVLAELRHIADSGDTLRRVRGRRGLDVLGELQKEIPLTVDETDYADVDEVDVKLLRLCKESGGTVVTNDYNLNKVAAVSGIRVLNINDLANALKPILTAGEELTVQVVREGKEPGQGVAYLDDGTMIVIENGRRHVGQTISVTVTTVLQTSAGRMIFSKANGGTAERV